jgi:acyl-[acyl carrier protein]--UDP-N-acetylglucosamine O-acyltransferase
MTKWTDIGAIAATWEKDAYGWQIAPAGLDWIAEGVRVRIAPQAYIGEEATIGEWVHIGEGARIGEGATIGECVHIGEEATIGEWVHIGEGARIGEGATIGEEATIGEWGRIGERAHIDEWVHIGEGVRIGPNSRNPVDLGWADGYRKCLAEVDGVAYIGAGRRWFTLDEALKHWGNHAKDRTMTLALLESGKAIANLKGWKWGRES